MRHFISAVLLFTLNVTASAADPSPTPVRVMSFNVRYATAPDGDNHWDKRKQLLADTVTTFDPDLLGTQETQAIQRDFLVEQLKGYEAFAAGRDDGKEKGEMAALFFRKERFEKTAGGHFWLSETPDTPGSKGWDAALPRIATWVKLTDRTDPKGKPVLFLNTHLDHMGEKARLQAAKLIRKKAVELGDGCRLIVTGDFNAGETSDPYTALFADADGKPSPLIDTLRTMYPTRGKHEGTFHGFKPDTTDGDRIDWIGGSRDWNVRLVGIDHITKDGHAPSDHFPVTAVLRAKVSDAKPTVRVLSYNIHHGEGTDGKLDLLRLAKVIRAADPDVVALQEVDDKTKRTKGVDQTVELARLTGMHGAFGKAIDFEGGGYGQSVLSRVPMGKGTVHTLPGEPDREQRIAFAVPLKLDGREFTFATTHLHHQSDDFRQKQAAKLNEVFADAKVPVVVAGDLNANPDSKPLALLTPKWTVTTGKDLLTFPAEKPTKQIDYVLFRSEGAFKIVEVKVIDEAVASDHRPLLAVLEWKAK